MSLFKYKLSKLTDQSGSSSQLDLPLVPSQSPSIMEPPSPEPITGSIELDDEIIISPTPPAAVWGKSLSDKELQTLFSCCVNAENEYYLEQTCSQRAFCATIQAHFTNLTNRQYSPRSCQRMVVDRAASRKAYLNELTETGKAAEQTSDL